VALPDAVKVWALQRSAAGSHTKVGLHAGTPSSFVQAGPTATPPGHHVPPTPHPCGATTAPSGAEDSVNAKEAAHIADATPWQVSAPVSHWRPVSHRVAERGPL
jgi:hypothetical protein